MDDCALHQYHRPAHLTMEHHHVIPQSWQLAWQPANFSGPRPSDLQISDYYQAFPDEISGPELPPTFQEWKVLQSLWDPRTELLCPTGHRNVHYWLVQFMHAVDTADSVKGEAAIRSLVLDVLHKRDQRRTAEIEMAQLGMTRFDAIGGDLKILPPLGLWGQA